MTMQTTNPLSPAIAASATAARNVTPERNADSARDNGGFGATLSRELAARQPTPPAAQAQAAQPQKSPQQQSKPNAADKPANREPVREPVRDQAARAGAKPASQDGEGKTAPATAKEGARDTDDAANAAEAAAAATTPVTDMLAFMASLTRPATAAAAVTETAAAATGAGATAGQEQLTALENALANMTGASAVTDDAAGKAVADAGAAFTLASGAQRAPVDTAAVQGQAGAALPEGEQDATLFQAQLRESQQQALPVTEEAPAPLAALQAQAAKLDAAGNPAAVPGDRIPARVGTQAWDNQVSQRIVYMVGKEQAATLTLNPPDLGPVQIVLNVSNDQATVAFSSEQLEVRQALENALPRLREMMSESGIALGNATVDAGAPGRQQQDSERRAQGGSGAGNLADGDHAAEPAVNEVAPRTRTVGLGERGMVDLFA